MLTMLKSRAAEQNTNREQGWMKCSDYEDEENFKTHAEVKVCNRQENGSAVSHPRRRANRKNLVFDKRDFLFPETSKEIRKQIQLDDVAMYSVTDMRTADEISDFIGQLDGLNQGSIVITDATACAGGNTSSFCKKFTKVQAVEIDHTRYNMLTHNLKLLGYKNAMCYRENYLNLLSNLKQDVVFMDPPWGGPSYKDQAEVELFLGDIPLEEVCESLKRRTKYVVIKAPTNLNYYKFKAKISGNIQVLHQFRKMLLIVVDYCHPSKVVLHEQITNQLNKHNSQTTTKEIQSGQKGINASNQKSVDESNSHDIVMKAAEYAQICYGDYIQDNYVYDSACSAAYAVARDGTDAARSAAIAAYQRAITDVNYASDYKDPHVANAYLDAALSHDYYVDDVDSADDFDGDSGHGTTNLSNVDGVESIDDTDDGIDHNDLTAACDAFVDNDDF